MRVNSFRFGTAIALVMCCSNLCHAQPVIAAPDHTTTKSSTASDAMQPPKGWLRNILFGKVAERPAAAPVDGEPSTADEATEKDYSIQTGSISSLSAPLTNTAAGLTDEAVPLCLDIAPPPAVLQTKSKYKSDDSSKSSIDDDALAARDKTVQPIRNSIRMLTNIAYAQSSSPAVMRARAECVLHNADRWASAKALTEMRSVDAYLSRDRWVAEIALAVQHASERAKITTQRKALYSSWFGTIADDTIDAYSLRLGPKSKTNNHRYWAGLSVAAIGFLVNDENFKKWGNTSFEIGACQVDEDGFLPAELSRGERALDYPVYALRPLAAIVKLAAYHDEPIQLKCLDGFKRLTVMTRDALRDPSEFARAAGLRQIPTSQEASYSAALKLDALSIF